MIFKRLMSPFEQLFEAFLNMFCRIKIDAQNDFTDATLLSDEIIPQPT